MTIKGFLIMMLSIITSNEINIFYSDGENRVLEIIYEKWGFKKESERFVFTTIQPSRQQEQLALTEKTDGLIRFKSFECLVKEKFIELFEKVVIQDSLVEGVLPVDGIVQANRILKKEEILSLYVHALEELKKPSAGQSQELIYLKVQRLLERAVLVDSNDFNCQLLLGIVKYRLSDFEGSRLAFEKAITIDPFDPRPYYYLRSYYFFKRDIKKILECCDKEVRYAKLAAKRKAEEFAERVANEAVAKKSRESSGLSLASEELQHLRQQEYEEAFAKKMEEYKHSVIFYSDYLIRGVLLIHTNVKKAEVYLKKALALIPVEDSREDVVSRREFYEEIFETETMDSEKDLKLYLLILENQGILYSECAREFQEKGEIEDCVKMYLESLKMLFKAEKMGESKIEDFNEQSHTNNLIKKRCKAAFYRTMGDLLVIINNNFRGAAFERIRDLVEKYKNFLRIGGKDFFVVMSNPATDLKERIKACYKKKANKNYKALLENKEGYAFSYYYYKAYCSEKSGEKENLLRCYSKAIREGGEVSNTYFMRAEYLFREEEYVLALADYGKCIEYRGGNYIVLQRLKFILNKIRPSFEDWKECCKVLVNLANNSMCPVDIQKEAIQELFEEFKQIQDQEKYKIALLNSVKSLMFVTEQVKQDCYDAGFYHKELIPLIIEKAIEYINDPRNSSVQKKTVYETFLYSLYPIVKIEESGIFDDIRGLFSFMPLGLDKKMRGGYLGSFVLKKNVQREYVPLSQEEKKERKIDKEKGIEAKGMQYICSELNQLRLDFGSEITFRFSNNTCSAASFLTKDGAIEISAALLDPNNRDLLIAAFIFLSYKMKPIVEEIEEINFVFGDVFPDKRKYIRRWDIIKSGKENEFDFYERILILKNIELYLGGVNWNRFKEKLIGLFKEKNTGAMFNDIKHSISIFDAYEFEVLSMALAKKYSNFNFKAEQEYNLVEKTRHFYEELNRIGTAGLIEYVKEKLQRKEPINYDDFLAIFGSRVAPVGASVSVTAPLATALSLPTAKPFNEDSEIEDLVCGEMLPDIYEHWAEYLRQKGFSIRASHLVVPFNNDINKKEIVIDKDFMDFCLNVPVDVREKMIEELGSIYKLNQRQAVELADKSGRELLQFYMRHEVSEIGNPRRTFLEKLNQTNVAARAELETEGDICGFSGLSRNQIIALGVLSDLWIDYVKKELLKGKLTEIQEYQFRAFKQRTTLFFRVAQLIDNAFPVVDVLSKEKLPSIQLRSLNSERIVEEIKAANISLIAA